MIIATARGMRTPDKNNVLPFSKLFFSTFCTPGNMLQTGNTQSIKARSLSSNNLASKHTIDENLIEGRRDARLSRLFCNYKRGQVNQIDKSERLPTGCDV